MLCGPEIMAMNSKRTRVLWEDVLAIFVKLRITETSESQKCAKLEKVCKNIWK